jgi:hypothetical protein
LAALSQLDRLGKSRKGAKRFFALPLWRRQTQLRDFLIGASRAAPCCASFAFFSINPRLNTKFQKVLAKSKARH